MAEFYDVTVDEILSGERKTYDEEVLSYKTQKEKRDGRIKLIKESALGKYNMFVYIALGCLAICWLLAVVFAATSLPTLYYVFLVAGSGFAIVVMFVGNYDVNRTLSSADDEVLDGVNEVKKEIHKKNLLVYDIVSIGLCAIMEIMAIISRLTSLGKYSAVEEYGVRVVDLLDIANFVFPIFLFISFAIMRPYFSAKKETKDRNELITRLQHYDKQFKRKSFCDCNGRYGGGGFDSNLRNKK